MSALHLSPNKPEESALKTMMRFRRSPFSENQARSEVQVHFTGVGFASSKRNVNAQLHLKHSLVTDSTEYTWSAQKTAWARLKRHLAAGFMSMTFRWFIVAAQDGASKSNYFRSCLVLAIVNDKVRTAGRCFSCPASSAIFVYLRRRFGVSSERA